MKMKQPLFAALAAFAFLVAVHPSAAANPPANSPVDPTPESPAAFQADSGAKNQKKAGLPMRADAETSVDVVAVANEVAVIDAAVATDTAAKIGGNDVVAEENNDNDEREKQDSCPSTKNNMDDDEVDVEKDDEDEDNVEMEQDARIASTAPIETLLLPDSTRELIEQLSHLPNIEVGNGITFRPRNNWLAMTLRFRMQNLLALSFDNNLTLTDTEARVKRLRLRFDGFIYSPKLVYSIQLGFTHYDAENLPNGNTNIVRDAIVYYVPNEVWNIGFGQTKLKTNRAQVNSSGALQFVDRSIVNREFNLDRDFGFFGEFNPLRGDGVNLSAKASVTSGEGRNWGNSSHGGLAYSARLELYPFGRFKAKGDVMEGDFEYEEDFRFLLAAAGSFNDRTSRLGGQRGALMPGDAVRSIGAYFVDLILKYRGWALYTDFMGRACDRPRFDADPAAYVYVGQGLNLQTSYLFHRKWEIALRNSTLFPSDEIQSLTGYRRRNQTTLGLTRYIIGHSLKVQADLSYDAYAGRDPRIIPDNFNRWQLRFQVELGL